MFLSVTNYKYDEVKYNHPEKIIDSWWWSGSRQNFIKVTKTFKRVAKELPGDYCIVWCSEFEAINCMFYTGNPSFGKIGREYIDTMKSKGYKVAAFNDALPEYIVKDTSILILNYSE